MTHEEVLLLVPWNQHTSSPTFQTTFFMDFSSISVETGRHHVSTVRKRISLAIHFKVLCSNPPYTIVIMRRGCGIVNHSLLAVLWVHGLMRGLWRHVTQTNWSCNVHSTMKRHILVYSRICWWCERLQNIGSRNERSEGVSWCQVWWIGPVPRIPSIRLVVNPPEPKPEQALRTSGRGTMAVENDVAVDDNTKKPLRI